MGDACAQAAECNQTAGKHAVQWAAGEGSRQKGNAWPAAGMVGQGPQSSEATGSATHACCAVGKRPLATAAHPLRSKQQQKGTPARGQALT